MDRNLREVVFDKMNELENAFNRNEHLDPSKKDIIKDQIAWKSKMWSIVSADDREWVQMDQMALDEQWNWQ